MANKHFTSLEWACFIIVYLLGYVASYRMGRKYLRKDFPDSYSWSTIVFILAMSLFSWISFTSAAFLHISSVKLPKSKPPEWL